jgi:class 3 adenylate cyclase
VRYAVDFRRALTEIDMQIRCGLHTGEVELRDSGDITGTAVNLAARVEQAADDGAILVSSTVRDIMLGSDLRFADAGEHLLKGFDGQWRLFAVDE